MERAFPVADPAVGMFYQMQEYHLGWRDESLRPSAADSGKLLRPRFCILACQAVGGTAATAEPLAAAIQLLHDFSLIHDDIEDHSPTRRGRKTVWCLSDHESDLSQPCKDEIAALREHHHEKCHHGDKHPDADPSES